MMTKLLDLGRTPPFLARRICRIPMKQMYNYHIVELIQLNCFYRQNKLGKESVEHC
jgi:hypothetical protein